MEFKSIKWEGKVLKVFISKDGKVPTDDLLDYVAKSNLTLYEIRGNDFDWKPATIENRVLINNAGYIIVEGKVDLLNKVDFIGTRYAEIPNEVINFILESRGWGSY